MKQIKPKNQIQDSKIAVWIISTIVLEFQFQEILYWLSGFCISPRYLDF